MEPIPGPLDELSSRELKYLEALVGAPTLEAAAESLGVSVATLRGRARSPRFLAAVRAARREAVHRAAAALSERACRAIACLTSILEDELAPHSARVSAARAILDATWRAAEADDSEERLSALEAWVATLAPPAESGTPAGGTPHWAS